MGLRSLVHRANDVLRASNAGVLAAAGELVLWRRLTRTEPSGRAPLGAASEPDFLTEETVVSALVQMNQKGEHFVYGQFHAQPGDLFVRLKGRPRTEAEAKRAPHAEHLSVFASDVRRDAGGRIVHARFLCTVDVSGRWGSKR